MILFEHQVKPVANAGSVTHILYPHELFHMLFCRFPDSAKLYFGAEPSQLRKFWTQFLGTAYGREAADKLPALRNKAPSELDHCIPLIVHGDGCPVTKKSSAMFVQWGGVARLAPVINVRKAARNPNHRSSLLIQICGCWPPNFCVGPFGRSSIWRQPPKTSYI